MSDEKKKSWREIDASRDRNRSGARRADPDERLRDKASKSAAYSRYKSNLDKLFSPGGALPEALKSQLGPADEGATARRKVLEDLQRTPSEATLRAYVATGQPLPPDPRLLMGLFDVRDEALVQAVLSRLLEVIEGGTAPNRRLLEQRLQALLDRAEEAETRALAERLRTSLG